MHFLEHIRKATPQGVEVEYRLLCSGELYPANVIGDWRRSDGARFLLREPFQLIVASEPYEDYPQELALRFTTEAATETSQSANGYVRSRRSFLPDVEIASDLAAVLSLLCRRLVTVTCKVRERYSDDMSLLPLRDWPVPFTVRAKPSYWKPRPASLICGPDGVEYRDNQPAPRGFDSTFVCSTLRRLPSLTAAEAFVRCARRYALALELIDTRCEIAYQHLVCAVETIAGKVLADWAPDDEAKVASKSALVKSAVAAGLSEEAARRLAIEASRDNPWSIAKFKRFLLDHTDNTVFDAEDDLFLIPDFVRMKKDDFDKYLSVIYKARSGGSHSGHYFPASASIGTSPLVPWAPLSEVLSGKTPFPPIGWFERVVNNAVCNYIRRATTNDSTPTSV